MEQKSLLQTLSSIIQELKENGQCKYSCFLQLRKIIVVFLLCGDKSMYSKQMRYYGTEIVIANAIIYHTGA